MLLSLDPVGLTQNMYILFQKDVHVFIKRRTCFLHLLYKFFFQLVYPSTDTLVCQIILIV